MTKYIEDKNVIDKDIDPQKQRIELLERNNIDQEKKDMWDDQNFEKVILFFIRGKIDIDYLKFLKINYKQYLKIYY